MAFSTSDIKTPQPTRQDFANAFGNNQRLIRFFEQLTQDVRQTIPDALVSVSDISTAPFVLTVASALTPNGFVLTAGTGITLTPIPGTLTVALSVPVPVNAGGTGATTAAAALANLGGVTAAGAAAAAPVQTVFGRTGNVVAQTGDYGYAQVTGAVNAAGAAAAAPVQTVFGRIGTVTAQAGDYSVGQVTGAAPLASPTFTGTVNAGKILVTEPGTSNLTLEVSATASANGANLVLAGNGATTPTKYLRAVNGLFEVVNNAYSGVPLTLTDAGALTVTGAVSGVQSRTVASTTNAQSIPNNALTTITTWTAALNQGANFNASTGAYTCPQTGQYDVRAAVRFASVAWAAAGVVAVAVAVNGTVVCSSTLTYTGSAVIGAQKDAAWIVNCNVADVITVQALQSSGAALALNGLAANNWLHISQMV